MQTHNTVSPRMSPRGLLSQNIFLGGGLYELGSGFLAAAKNISRINFLSFFLYFFLYSVHYA